MRPESPLLRAARQADLDARFGIGDLCIYVAGLMAIVYVLALGLSWLLDTLAELAR